LQLQNNSASGVFVLFRLNLIGQKKLLIVFPLSGMLCLWPWVAEPFSKWGGTSAR